MFTELVEFLRGVPPFDALPDETLSDLAGSGQVEYFPKGARILSQGGQPVEFLYFIRSGSVEARKGKGAASFFEVLGPGDLFGSPEVIKATGVSADVVAREDTVCFLLPGETLSGLFSDHPEVAAHLSEGGAGRLRAAPRLGRAGFETRGSELLGRRVADVLARVPVTVTLTTPIREAATLMGGERISSLVVTDPSGRPVGILTDRDLRNRVVSAGLDPATAVEAIMSRPLITIDAGASLLDALEAIIRHGIHHLAVMKEGRLIGVFTDTDLLRLEAAHPAFLVRELDRQTKVEGVAQIQMNLPRMIGSLEAQGLPATRIARIIAGINDRLVAHLLKLAESELGPPPVPYCWLALGSEGRREQALSTDQDNAIVFADPPGDRETVEAYFARLGEWMEKGLDASGFPLCPGRVMAGQPEWRRSLSSWLEVIRGWISLPEPKHLLALGELLDLRAVAGDFSLAERMVETIHLTAKDYRGLFPIIAKSALRNHPPLGFFGRLVVSRSGEHAHTLDLKGQGTALVAEAARAFALDAGSRATNSLERLEAAREKGLVSAGLVEEVREGYEFLMTLRLRCQLRALGVGRPPENWVEPRELTPRERHHLKDAFRAVRGFQDVLAATYQTHLLAES